MARFLVTGASGMLGSALVRALIGRGDAVVAAFRTAKLAIPGADWVASDLRRTGEASALVDSTRPDAILHCAAMTSVDGCEASPHEARALHVEAPAALARRAEAIGARFLYVSTDSVFDGTRAPYAEDDPAVPVNEYARTKRAGEGAVLDAARGALVLRTNFFGRSPSGRSLAEWILSRLRSGEEIPGFVDVVFNPLYVEWLAATILELLETGTTGVLHAGARDAASKYDFARRLAEVFDLDPERVRPSRLAEAGLAAPRPLRTVLAIDRIEAVLGRSMPDLAEGLAAFRNRETSTIQRGG